MTLVLVNPHAQGGRVRQMVPALREAADELVPFARVQAPERVDEALDILRRDVDAGLEVGCTHLPLQRRLALDRNFEVTNLFGVLHTCGHHHRVGLLRQQLVLPGLCRNSQRQPPAPTGDQTARVQGECADGMGLHD